MTYKNYPEIKQLYVVVHVTGTGVMEDPHTEQQPVYQTDIEQDALNRAKKPPHRNQHRKIKRWISCALNKKITPQFKTANRQIQTHHSSQPQNTPNPTEMIYEGEMFGLHHLYRPTPSQENEIQARGGGQIRGSFAAPATVFIHSSTHSGALLLPISIAFATNSLKTTTKTHTTERKAAQESNNTRTGAHECGILYLVRANGCEWSKPRKKRDN